MSEFLIQVEIGETHVYGNQKASRASVALAPAKESAKDATSPIKVVTLFVDGEVGIKELSELQGELEGLWRQGLCHVILDLSEVSHLDYRGVRALVQRAQDMRQAGGDVKLAGMSPYLNAIFRASGAHGVFESYATPQMARDAFLGSAERV